VIITGGGLAHFADVYNQDVTFAGPGTLQLDQSVIYDGDALTSSYTGTISGFGKGDTIDLTALNYSSTETDVWNSATHADHQQRDANTAAFACGFLYPGQFRAGQRFLGRDRGGVEPDARNPRRS
jgi:hypothetical protein